MARVTSKGVDCHKPEWALRELRGMGLSPDTSMDDMQERWRSWWSCDNPFYTAGYDMGESLGPEERISLRPAQMVAEEWPALIMTDGTELRADDPGMAAWIGRAMPDWVDDNADFVAQAFALGCGAWTVAVDGLGGSPATSLERHPAWATVPLEGEGVATLARVSVGGRPLDRLQVHAPDPDTGHYRVRTRLFTVDGHREVASDEVAADVDTGQPLPTYAIVRPSRSNPYSAYSQAGVSCFDSALDAVRVVDESYNQLYWQVRVSLPRVFVDEAALARDPETGTPLGRATVDHVIFRAVRSVEGAPVSVYNPDTHVGDMVASLDCALSTLGLKAGFGQDYFSFDRASGLKTATEVVSDNAALMRNVRRHENAIEAALTSVVRAAYATEEALNGRPLAEVPHPSVTWDDSVVTDTEAERATMKDDIARGLCPAWLYPARYYGMDEAEARAFTGDAAAGLPDLG